MPVSLDKLDRESVMMLYLGGELEAADREAFERQLAAEPQLAAELEQLRAAQESLSAQLEHADAHTRLPASEGVAVRRVARAVNAWIVGRSAAPPMTIKRGVLFPWWSYPAVIAASVIFGFIVWSSRQEVPPMEPLQAAKDHMDTLEAEQADLAEWLTTSLDVADATTSDTELGQLLSRGLNDELNAVYLSPQPEEMTQ